jgi:transcriptional regulator with PAS, ATPase and Fis domain
LFARAIHSRSARKARPLVKVNCAALPANLIESELFGHERGAFTGALQKQVGRFEVADGGTIFLDEIAELAPEAQVKLLRVLQDRTYEVLGTSQTRTVDIRVLSATNRPLADMVQRGEFREDLLYRLNLITIHLPPLRQRPDDIPVLASRFLRAAAEIYGRDQITISPAALRWLRTLPWPGNVRQLRQWIERAVLVTSDDTLDVGHFRSAAEMEPSEVPRDTLPAVGTMTMDEMERAMIEKSLRFHAGNLTKVADSLGLSRPALYRRLEKYGIGQ